VNTRYRSGSRLQACWEKFESDGADAMVAVGVSLGVSLGVLKQWRRMWTKEKESGAPVPTNGAAPPAKTAAQPAPRSNGKSKTWSAPTVVVKWDRERTAYLIEKGPEQSHVRWADTREERFFSNRELEFGDA